MSELVDTHAHLADRRLAPRLDAVLAAAFDRHVAQVLAIGTTAADSAEVMHLAGAHAGVFASVGIQPNHVAEAQPGDWDAVAALARDARVVALGETGLDRYWDHTPFDLQQDFFGRHLELAHALGKPVVIHCRECETDLANQLAGLKRQVSGVLHSFTGTWEHAKIFLALGLHLSFAGMVTFPSPKLDPLRHAAAQAPLERLLVETDSPYLAPQSIRGKTNEPQHVAETAAFLANLRGISLDEFASATTANARRLFGLDARDCLGSARLTRRDDSGPK